MILDSAQLFHLLYVVDAKIILAGPKRHRMGCTSSSQPKENPAAQNENQEGGADGEGVKIKKAARRDSIAVHKRHLQKASTLEDRSAPAGVNVERYE